MDRHLAPRIETRTESFERERFDVWNEVPLVPQTTGMSCWAAAAAMLVGWRERVPVDPQAVASGAGRWAAYREGLEPDDVPSLARAWGLYGEPATALTIARVRELLERCGPLWLGEASPGLHSLVVTGIYGDGAPEGTHVRINDPWPIDRGERYVLRFDDLQRNFAAATLAVGDHVQLLHAGGRGRGARGSARSYERRSITTSTLSPEQDMYAFDHAQSFGYGQAAIAEGQRLHDTTTWSRDPLAGHGGTGTNLALRWSAMTSAPERVDVVVHFHGYSSSEPDAALLNAKLTRSGAVVSGRPRPTVAMIPRGALLERRSGRPHRYGFPALLAHNGAGLEDFIDLALAQWAADLGVGKPAIARLIFTAHSGGGAPVERLLADRGARRACNPEEVHLHDALYSTPRELLAWAGDRITVDRSSHPTRVDMQTHGGALRIVYGSGTAAHSEPAATSLARMLDGGPALLREFYRVEHVGLGHDAIPEQLGPPLLLDAAASLPGATAAPALRATGHGYGTPMGLFTRITHDLPRGDEAAALRHTERYQSGDDGPEFPSDDELAGVVAERESSLARGQALQVRPLTVTPQPGWAADARSVDYRHISNYSGVSVAFDFGGGTLAALATANRFTLPAEGIVVFGLRGCQISSGNDGAFHASVRLTETVPDHTEARCVLGVWNRANNQVAVFCGSTVPHHSLMRAQLGNSGREANMMLTGLYRLRIGTHRSHYRGMFIESGAKLVLRSRDDLVYTTDDDFDRCSPGDNLHPSFRRASLEFSSAGCITVRGSASKYRSGRDSHVDPDDGTPGWASFRAAAGLTRDRSATSEDGREFKFMLLTGREARIVDSERTAANLLRLRQGSTGAEVGQLQTWLANNRDAAGSPFYSGSIDDDMGPRTVEAWVNWQRSANGQADGIVTPVDATGMGFNLT